MLFRGEKTTLKPGDRGVWETDIHCLSFGRDGSFLEFERHGGGTDNKHNIILSGPGAAMQLIRVIADTHGLQVANWRQVPDGSYRFDLV